MEQTHVRTDKMTHLEQTHAQTQLETDEEQAQVQTHSDTDKKTENIRRYRHRQDGRRGTDRRTDTPTHRQNDKQIADAGTRHRQDDTPGTDTGTDTDTKIDVKQTHVQARL